MAPIFPSAFYLHAAKFIHSDRTNFSIQWAPLQFGPSPNNGKKKTSKSNQINEIYVGKEKAQRKEQCSINRPNWRVDTDK